jgi:hypothetical protein
MGREKGEGRDGLGVSPMEGVKMGGTPKPRVRSDLSDL